MSVDERDHPGARIEHISAYAALVRWTPAEIKKQRDARALSQDQLAKLVGVSRRAITNWETGQAEPRGSNLRALELTLGGQQEREDLSLIPAADLAAELIRRLTEAERILDHDRLRRDSATANWVGGTTNQEPEQAPPPPRRRGLPGTPPSAQSKPNRSKRLESEA